MIAVDAGAATPPWQLAAAEPPRADCAPGWYPVNGADGLAICQPWESGRPNCTSPVEGALPGVGTCVHFGNVCPEGDFADELPADHVLYVSAGAAPGGTGTFDQPFATIAQALVTASRAAVDTIAVGKGVYTESVSITADVTLVGACAEETIVRQDDPAQAVVAVRDSHLVASNLWIRHEAPGLTTAAESLGSSVIDLDHVVSDGMFRVHDGARLAFQAEASLLRASSRIFSADGSFSRFRLRRVAVVATEEMYSYVDTDSTIDGSVLQVEDSAFYTSPAADPELDYIQFNGFDTLEFTRVASGTHLILLQDTEGPANTSVQDVFVKNWDYGMTFWRRNAAVRRLFIESEVDGIFAVGGQSTIEDSVIRSGRAALTVLQGAELDLTRVAVSGQSRYGVMYERSSGHVADLSIRNMTADEEGIGRGLEIQGSTVVLNRISVDRSLQGGVMVFDAGGRPSEVEIGDAVIQRTEAAMCPEGCIAGGVGLGVYGTGTVSLRRFHIAEADFCGVYLDANATLDLIQGEVSSNVIGVCLAAVYDLSRLTSEVLYVDNGKNLDTSNLPIPDPGIPLLPQF